MGKKFISVEQYFMFHKARFSDDSTTADAIMATDDAVQAKTLGKNIANFDPKRWREVCDSYMYSGVKAKFEQNQDLLACLKGTDAQVLVEANSNDVYWSCGLSLENHDLWDISK